METSDNPIVQKLRKFIAPGLEKFVVDPILGPKDKKDKAGKPIENPTETAKSIEQVSEAARRKRRRDASLLTKGFGRPTLGQPGLLGRTA